MYIFKYQTKEGKFIGFHASTFCQTVQEESKAKHYGCIGDEEVKAQKETISNNLKYALDKQGVIADTYFKGLTFEDVELIPQFVQDKQLVYSFHDLEGNDLTANEVVNRAVSEHSPEQN